MGKRYGIESQSSSHEGHAPYALYVEFFRSFLFKEIDNRSFLIYLIWRRQQGNNKKAQAKWLASCPGAG